MIGYLRGPVLDHSEGKLLVATAAGDLPAVGYAVIVPQTMSYSSLLPGKTAELFIYTHVREDSLDLYGFATRGEKELFLTLLGVNGIGPKVAIGILSKIEPDHLLSAIAEGDKATLTRIPGIGKKTAERVVLELGDAIRKKMDSGIFLRGIQDSQASDSAGKPIAMGRREGAGASPAYRMARDAKDALMGLGYREPEVSAAIQEAMEKKEAPPAKVEDLIRTALQCLS